MEGVPLGAALDNILGAFGKVENIQLRGSGDSLVILATYLQHSPDQQNIKKAAPGEVKETLADLQLDLQKLHPMVVKPGSPAGQPEWTQVTSLWQLPPRLAQMIRLVRLFDCKGGAGRATTVPHPPWCLPGSLGWVRCHLIIGIGEGSGTKSQKRLLEDLKSKGVSMAPWC